MLINCSRMMSITSGGTVPPSVSTTRVTSVALAKSPASAIKKSSVGKSARKK
jgi:hypothetical protein